MKMFTLVFLANHVPTHYNIILDISDMKYSILISYFELVIFRIQIVIILFIFFIIINIVWFINII